MSAQHIVNQDRDRIYRFNADALIYTAPVLHDGMCMGNNLMMGNAFLGTFETPEEAMREVSNIYNHTGEIYAVSGFSDWGGAV